MWKSLSKGSALDESEVRFEADGDGRTEDDLSDDDAEVTGSIFATLPTKGGTTEYEFPNQEFQDYLDWQDDGFTLQWLNDNLTIDYTVGGWGWPWGRDHATAYGRGK